MVIKAERHNHPLTLAVHGPTESWKIPTLQLTGEVSELSSSFRQAQHVDPLEAAMRLPRLPSVLHGRP